MECISAVWLGWRGRCSSYFYLGKVFQSNGSDDGGESFLDAKKLGQKWAEDWRGEGETVAGKGVSNIDYFLSRAIYLLNTHLVLQ